MHCVQFLFSTKYMPICYIQEEKNMDIYKIFTFCAIVDYGTVSKAAEALYCSQPALSKQMASLEKEIGYR